MTVPEPPSASADSRHAMSARDKWRTLIAESFERRPKRIDDPGLHYWDYIEGLPNVLIYGDSISIDYSETVRRQLMGEANVIRLPANGNHSGKIIENMIRMQASMSDLALSDPWRFEWDFIHFNAGLHDLKYVASGKLDKRNGTQVNSIEDYVRNLTDAIAYFQQTAPNAQLIFATTTPVPEGEPGRFVEDAVLYNEAATALMREVGIPVNDLYSFTLPALDSWIIDQGNVHYKEEASHAQGVEIARFIRTRMSE
ncbi:MAG: SGNH/GDSL hydrolase family protein [Pseudomonadota bacterium]